jgi:hypothetical protein
MMPHPTKTSTADDPRRNMLSTYFYLRTGIVAMSAALPIALIAYSLIFAYYWFTKTQEYSISSADKRALEGKLQYAGGRVAPAPPSVSRP